MEEHRMHGERFGIVLKPRGKGDRHVYAQLICEDDEEWFALDEFSSHFVQDLLKVLGRAEAILEGAMDKDPSGLGYVYKGAPPPPPDFRALLGKYAKHTRECAKSGSFHPEDDECTCGLDKIVAESGITLSSEKYGKIF